MDDFIPFLSDTKFRVGLWWKTFLVSIAIIIPCFLVWVQINVFFIHHAPTPAAYESIPIFIGENLILAPICEEIIQCFFLSCIFITSKRITTNKWKIWLINGFALICVSLLLMIGHANFNPISLLLLFSLFMIYGGIYYLNDRNLLPAIIAHSAWNLLVILTFPF